jgi:hypothetical protein
LFVILIIYFEDSSSTISSWLIDYYFTKIYLKQIQNSNKSIQPNNIIGLHDMFIIYQIIQSSSSSSKDFFELCKNKFYENKNNLILENYQNYLKRCGLIDIIDLFHQCKLKLFIKILNLNINNIKNEIDRLFFDYLLEIAFECSIYDEKTQISTVETRQNILKLLEKEKEHIEQTISKVCHRKRQRNLHCLCRQSGRIFLIVVAHTSDLRGISYQRTKSQGGQNFGPGPN